MTYLKPLPKMNPGTEGFWASAKAHQLALPWCLDCGEPHYFPQEVCPKCWGSNLEYRKVQGEGTLYSFCVLSRPPSPEFRDDVPYVLCAVDLTEGPRMIATLVDFDPERVHIGLRVRLVYDDVTPAVTLPRFTAEM
jgi:uncharacterized OB-fold protein